MKYIKRYLESKRDEVVDQITTELAYILDMDNTKLTILHIDSYDSGQFNFELKSTDYQYFNWDEIKNQFIPFLQRFKYQIINLYNGKDGPIKIHALDAVNDADRSKFFTVDQVISDSDIPTNIIFIEFCFQV